MTTSIIAFGGMAAMPLATVGIVKALGHIDFLVWKMRSTS